MWAIFVLSGIAIMFSTLPKKQKMHYALAMVALVCIIPFSLNTRFLPYTEFYQDISIILLGIGSLLVIILSNPVRVFFPRPCVYLLLLACIWTLQGMLTELPYADKNYRVAFFFIVLAGISSAVYSLIIYWGKEKVTVWIMWAIIIGAFFQIFVMIMQMTGLAQYLSGICFYNLSHGSNNQYDINGQFGQRNLLGHYLMWAIIANAYLISSKHIKLHKGIWLMLIIGGAIGIVSSRSIILYIIVLFIFFLLAKIFSKNKSNHINPYLYGLITVLISQWAMPFLLIELFDYKVVSGLNRMHEAIFTGISSRQRLDEFYKAWLIFTEHPIIGSGWGTYTFHSFDKDILIVPDSTYHTPAAFKHSHNILLQILSEMGIIGFIAFVVGGLWVILPLLKKFIAPKTIAIFSLIVITLTHSLVEYPLWYSCFIAAFTILCTLGQPIDTPLYSDKRSIKKMTVTLYTIIFMLGLGMLSIKQYFFIRANKEVNSYSAHANAIMDMAEVFPFFKEYKDTRIIISINPNKTDIDNEDVEAIERYIHYNPVSLAAHQHGIYLYRKGKVAESLSWMKKVWHNYPQTIPKSMELIYTNSPLFKKLEKPVHDTCVRYSELNLYPNLFQGGCAAQP